MKYPKGTYGLYSGYWKNDAPNGPGRWVKDDNMIDEGLYENGYLRYGRSIMFGGNYEIGH